MRFADSTRMRRNALRVPRRTVDIFALLFDSRSVPLLFIVAALIVASGADLAKERYGSALISFGE